MIAGYFFIDEHPFQSWAHECRYVFVNIKTNEIETIRHSMPPRLDSFTPLIIQKIDNPEQVKNEPIFGSKSDPCTINDDWAVIINGGMDYIHNHERYWNHISGLYRALIGIYNYQENHIIVLNSDGTNLGNDRHLNSGGYDSSPQDLDGDGDNDIDFSATRTNIHTVFQNLSNTIQSSDNVFIYTTDHGGQTSGNDVYLVLWGEVITDAQFAAEVNLLNAANISLTFVQCFSGGFIDNIAGTNRVITTATTAYQPANSASPYNYSEFTYHWISAIAGATPDNHTTVDADSNDDGYVSFQEAFTYAYSHDIFSPSTETPQFSTNPSILGQQMTPIGNLPYLSGPSTLCSGGGTYTIGYLSPGDNVTWNSSQNITRTSLQGSNPCNFQGQDFGGEGWITATVAMGCDQFVFNMPVWSGRPWAVTVYPSGNPAQLMGIYSPLDVAILTSPGANLGDANWSSSGSITTTCNCGSSGSFYSTSPGTGYFFVTPYNICGDGTMYQGEVWVEDGMGNKISQEDEEITLSPNPAKDFVKVDLSRNTNEYRSNTYLLQIIDSQSRIVKSYKVNSLPFEMNIQDLSKGQYIVTLQYSNKVISKVLLVQ